MAYTATMEFIETPIFTREIKKLLPDEAYRQLQIVLLLRPDAGDLVRGGGGLRKLRWGIPGQGKRGGLRVIYYWDVPDKIYMLLPYKKAAREDLAPSQLKELRKLVKEVLK
jgi:mRNA-degrading endonuclease RelE of RelBE toxin-antitoxin system